MYHHQCFSNVEVNQDNAIKSAIMNPKANCSQYGITQNLPTIQPFIVLSNAQKIIGI
jgi:hypothetical protein